MSSQIKKKGQKYKQLKTNNNNIYNGWHIY